MKIQILFLILLISFVSAECNSGQIDVNSASLVDLDKLAGVGPATAQNIVDSRPYTSLNDLLNATGIGEAKLASIKSQGLACVSTTDSHEKSPKNSEKDIEYSSKKSSEEELDPEFT